MEESDEDPASRGAEGVAESDCAAVDIDLGGVEAEDPLDGEADSGKGFVDLELANVSKVQAGTLQGEGDGERRRKRKVDGVRGGVGVGYDSGQDARRR